ncbi:MAG: A/G-specific adenine glycosylase, partial [Actinomycetia bacterium]|nr:A/G-specific adenine glycosylase [Actinomycetes bacterium]
MRQTATVVDGADVVDVLVLWFARSARTLPWRSDPHPWGVLVSEVMLQQTPVARVLPVYAEWMQRWPT